ncbi:hypothetical protein [Flavisolibacter nicotianae]|uniref:hypothetical protein n=1 Tax=Flavisolibacter nicotianae TaxID=2364882 RepID=UPI000EAC391D|nr:hypothetical protein [Flavisolibacter nicotianae]
MTYDFYADQSDKLSILNYIFNETDLQVYDLASLYGQQIRHYKSSDEIAAKFDLINGDKFAVAFQLWTPRHGSKPIIRKVDLDPKHCNGHTFRYSTDGLGMIQLYFGGVKNGTLSLSHIGHFSEKDAAKWEETNKLNGSIEDWDWKEVQATSKKLKQYVRSKLAVQKLGILDILPGASRLQELGIKLR